MTTADLECSLDRVPSDLKSAGERSDRRAPFVRQANRETVTVSEFCVQSSPLVCGLSDGLDVFRVDTKAVATEMISLKGVRPRTDTLLPHRTVSHHVLISHSHLPIAALTHRGAMPDPAGSGIPSVLNRKVPLINQSDSLRHTSAPYHTFSMRVEEEGYEAP